MRPRASLVAAALALLASPAPTVHAQDPGRVLVASDGIAQLFVSELGDDLCVGVRTPLSDARSCELDELGVVHVSDAGEDVRYAAAGVPVPAATVELRRAGQLIAAGPTIAGEAYTGKRAGQVRFALFRVPPSMPADGLRLRALDAAGALVSVISPFDFVHDDDLVTDRRRLFSGRARGGVRWSVEAHQKSVLEQSVADLGHEALSRCAEVRISPEGPSTHSELCAGAEPLASVSIFGDERTASAADRCGPPFRLLHGLLDAAVRRVSVQLGGGRRHSAPLVALGDGLHVVYALAVAREAAVRSIRFERVDGTSRVLALGQAPLDVTCAAGSEEDLGLTDRVSLQSPALLAALSPVAPAGPVASIATQPAVRVADGPAGTLCLAVGTQPFRPFNCAVVSPLLDEVLFAAENDLRPGAFAVAVPARVATLRIAGPGGNGRREIATVPGDGYAGAYAGKARFAIAGVTSPEELRTFELLGANGAVLHRTNLPAPDAEAPGVAVARRIAGRPGRPSLWERAVRGSRLPCVVLTRGPRPPAAAGCGAVRSAGAVLLDASCVTRRLTVAVTPGTGTRVRVDTGRAGSRAIVLRGGAGLLTLAPSSSLRSLTFVSGGKAHRVRVNAPSGARQCGWSAAF